MREKILVADDDMLSLQFMYDVLETTFKDANIERALSQPTFWTKAAAVDGQNPWDMIFLSLEYVREDMAGFLAKIKAINPDVMPKIIITGQKQDLESRPEELNELRFLTIPFSLDAFEEMVKGAPAAG